MGGVSVFQSLCRPSSCLNAKFIPWISSKFDTAVRTKSWLHVSITPTLHEDQIKLYKNFSETVRNKLKEK